jgi:hypothetical protein
VTAFAFGDLQTEYIRLWNSMTVRPDKAAFVERIVKRLTAHRQAYAQVQRATGVPWFVVAVDRVDCLRLRDRDRLDLGPSRCGVPRLRLDLLGAPQRAFACRHRPGRRGRALDRRARRQG